MSLLDIGTELRHERYFDSHPRVGDDFAADGADLRGFISIRTLAWGVTCAVYPVSLQTEISIRTPAWGVTRHGKRRRAPGDFNSHPRVGGDACFPA